MRREQDRLEPEADPGLEAVARRGVDPRDLHARGIDEAQLHQGQRAVDVARDPGQRCRVTRAGRRVAHWERVVQGACEQSGRAVVPSIAAPVALPAWVASLAGDVSAFVPTNVISITDGQIFLETSLFNAGIRPAINAGISVSRVGGAAQTKLIKSLSGGIRTDLAQYRELAAFAQFASDLDEATRKQLDRGARVTELLKQAQYTPQSISIMAVTLFAVNKGYMDDVEVKKILAFESALHNFMKTSHAELLKKIEDTKQLDKDAEAALAAAIADFKKSGAY